MKRKSLKIVPIERAQAKRITERLREVAARYLSINHEMSKLSAEKAEHRRVGLQALEALGERDVVYPSAYGDIKVQRYQTIKAEYDVGKLRELLGKKLARTVLRVTVDERALDAAVERGAIALEDLETVAKVEKSWGFRVDRLKKPDSEEA